MKIHRLPWLLSMLLILLSSTSCGSSSEDEKTLPPEISSLEPANGKSGSVATICGTNFGTDAKAIKVNFGSAQAQIVTVSDNRIEVIVPRKERDGSTAMVTVSILGQILYKKQFTYTSNGPMISSLGTSRGVHWQEITIHGEGFNLDAAKNQVAFNDIDAVVKSASETQLTVEVPYIYESYAYVQVHNADYPENPSNVVTFLFDLDKCDSLVLVNADWAVDLSREGVVCKRAEMKIFNTLQRISVVDIMLSANIKIGIHNTTTLKKTSILTDEVNAFAGINASFFASGGPLDYVRVDGKKVVTGRTIVGNDPTINMSMTIAGKNAISWARIKNNTEAAALMGDHVITVGPALWIDSEKQYLWEESTHNTAKNPRSLIGTTKDAKRLLMVAVDGRQAKAAGMTAWETSKLMYFFGAVSAMNLDGGGSTALYFKGTAISGVVNDVATERAVGNVIYAKLVE